YRVATTAGYGPRYLHSTGQLHKGGPNTGVFLQIVGDDPRDLPIPGADYTFGVLKQAQALGDYQALRNHGRRVLRVQVADVELGQKLKAPRTFWMMIPAGAPVDDTIQRLQGVAAPGDVIIDGGNSNYKDSVRRGEALATQQVEYMDAGVSGGVWGLQVGFCLM